MVFKAYTFNSVWINVMSIFFGEEAKPQLNATPARGEAPDSMIAARSAESQSTAEVIELAAPPLLINFLEIIAAAIACLIIYKVRANRGSAIAAFLCAWMAAAAMRSSIWYKAWEKVHGSFKEAFNRDDFLTYIAWGSGSLPASFTPTLIGCFIIALYVTHRVRRKDPIQPILQNTVLTSIKLLALGLRGQAISAYNLPTTKPNWPWSLIYSIATLCLAWLAIIFLLDFEAVGRLFGGRSLYGNQQLNIIFVPILIICIVVFGARLALQSHHHSRPENRNANNEGK